VSPANQDYLGTGWSFPPTFASLNHGVEMVKDGNDIHESLWILFSTNLGERIMLPQYGSGLGRMVFRAISTTMMSQMKSMVTQAILNWEVRITVNDVQVQPDPATAGRVLISVAYTIRKTNTRANLVYPFYLTENTIPAINS
jgi:phage baseplate assembly protein W